MSSSRLPTVLLAGGGSGGHLFPGIAVAQQVSKLAAEARIFFLCSDRPIDARILGKTPWPAVALPARPPSLRPFPKAPLVFARSWRLSRIAVRQFVRESSLDPASAVMITLGGFVSAPAAIEARSLGIQTVLCNLDAVAGKANRFLASRVDEVLTAVECTDLDRWKPDVVGMPVREEAISTMSPAECRTALGLDPAISTLLVTGASQGASTFNQLLPDLVRIDSSPFRGWQILHLTGDAQDTATLMAAYKEQGVRAKVLDFTTQMGQCWGAATLALSRCGASSVAEAVGNAVPTIFSPYPWHKDLHQARNAQKFVDDGLAWLVDDAIDPAENRATLGAFILRQLEEPGALRSVHERLQALPNRSAAETIASRLLARFERWSG